MVPAGDTLPVMAEQHEAFMGFSVTNAAQLLVTRHHFAGLMRSGINTR